MLTSDGRVRAFWRLAIQYGGFRILVPVVFNVIVVGLVLGGSVGRAKPGGLDDPGFPDAVIPLASGLAGLAGAIRNRVACWTLSGQAALLEFPGSISAPDGGLTSSSVWSSARCS